MEEREERDAQLVARELIRRFGGQAVAAVENWSRLNHEAGEQEAGHFWARVAWAVRGLQAVRQSHRPVSAKSSE